MLNERGNTVLTILTIRWWDPVTGQRLVKGTTKGRGEQRAAGIWTPSLQLKLQLSLCYNYHDNEDERRDMVTSLTCGAPCVFASRL